MYESAVPAINMIALTVRMWIYIDISAKIFSHVIWASFLSLISNFPGELFHSCMKERASGARHRNQPAACLRNHILTSFVSTTFFRDLIVTSILQDACRNLRKFSFFHSYIKISQQETNIFALFPKRGHYIPFLITFISSDVTLRISFEFNGLFGIMCRLYFSLLKN
jgi:hypothetical protein